MTKVMEELSLDEWKNGWHKEEDSYLCNVCGKPFYAGEIYSFETRMFEAKKAVLVHLQQDHPTIFEVLITSNSKYVNMTDNQKELLHKFHQGCSDSDIAGELGVSASTIRHQRFMFKEKAKQAKMFLSLYDLAFEKKKELLLPIHNHATSIDERYMTTEKEQEQVLKVYFTGLNPLRLKTFPAKEKKKLVVLRMIVEQFEANRKYTEKEVNEILKAIFHDFVAIRRYLIEYGYFARTNDGSEYWLK